MEEGRRLRDDVRVLTVQGSWFRGHGSSTSPATRAMTWLIPIFNTME